MILFPSRSTSRGQCRRIASQNRTRCGTGRKNFVNSITLFRQPLYLSLADLREDKFEEPPQRQEDERARDHVPEAQLRDEQALEEIVIEREQPAVVRL